MRESILESLRQSFLSRTPLEALPEGVWKRTAALNTWGTNAIEGNTLTWRDVERLLLQDRSIGGRPVRDILETIQHQEVLRGLLARLKVPLGMTTALEFHEAVFRGVLPDAGHWRHVSVRIAGSKHRPPLAEAVVPALTEWEEAYARQDIAGEHVFPLGTWLHHRFEAIHPFQDGNGRVGRLLLNLHFLKHSWPPLHILPPDRVRYLATLEAGHKGDLRPLEDLLKGAMARSLLDLLDQVGTAEDELKPLTAFEGESHYSAKYLALRASQAKLPALKESGAWQTSRRAMRLYRQEIGRR